MWEGFIGNQIRRANTRLLVVNVLFLLGVIAVVAGNWNYLNNWFRGCAPTDPAVIGRLQNPDELSRNFVSLDVSEIQDSGMQEVETENGKDTGRTLSAFVYAPVGNRVLVVKTKPAMGNAKHLEGQLVAMPADLDAELHKGLKPEETAALLPFLLDTKDYRDNGWWLLALCLPVLAIVFWNLWKWMQRSRDFAAHPIVKQLGGEQVVLQYGAQLDTEMTGGGEKFGASTLTQSWLVVPYFMGAHIARLEDVAWIHKKTTQHRVNFVPAGKTFEALLYRRNGTTVSAPGKQEQIDKLLQTIVTRYPWVIAGWTADLENAWKKDRNGFLAAVEQRRAKAKGAAASS